MQCFARWRVWLQSRKLGGPLHEIGTSGTYRRTSRFVIFPFARNLTSVTGPVVVRESMALLGSLAVVVKAPPRGSLFGV